MNSEMHKKPDVKSLKAQCAYWPWRRIFGSLLVIWFIVVWASAWKKAPTFDEVPHIAAGLSYWKYNDYRMNPEHPALVKLLAVLPAMALDNTDIKVEWDDFQVRPWLYSDQFRFGHYLLYLNKIDGRAIVFHSRMVPVVIGVVGGLFAFWWGRRIGGTVLGGATAGVLLLLYPEYAGHARFVTFDVPALVACAGVSAASYNWWTMPCKRNTGWFVFAATVGSVVKLPVVVFTVFVLITLILLAIVPHSRIRLKNVLSLILITGLASYAMAWAASGFRFSFLNPAMEITERSVYAPADGNFGVGWLSDFLAFCWSHRLLPETSLAVLAAARSFEMRNYYFMGEWSRSGWYSYFFATFALKTSLVMIGAYAAASVTWTVQLLRMHKNRRRFECGRLILLCLPFAMLFVVMVLSRANLGHRYILFIYFPLSVLTGSAMVRWWLRSRVGRTASISVLCYGVLVFALQYPHYATYFNEVIRTPYRALPYLGDSNVDWGQDLPLIGEGMRDYKLQNVNLAAFGSGSPEVSGITNYRWILPNYPFAVFQKEKAVDPDPRLYTAMTLNGLLAARSIYHGKYLLEPEWINNGAVLFAPDAEVRR